MARLITCVTFFTLIAVFGVGCEDMVDLAEVEALLRLEQDWDGDGTFQALPPDSAGTGDFLADFGQAVVRQISVRHIVMVNDESVQGFLVWDRENGIRLGEGTSSSFHFDRPPVSELEPGQTTAIAVYYVPEEETGADGTLIIETNDPDNQEVVVRLSGSGVSPDIQVCLIEAGSLTEQCNDEIQPGTLKIDFGACDLGEGNSRQFLVRNQGVFQLSIAAGSGRGGVDFGTGTSSEYILDPGPWTGSLEPGESKPFSVNYTPGDGGPDEGTVEISSNDPDEPMVVVDLLGSGLAPRICPQPPLVVDFGSIQVGTTSQKSFRFTSCGNQVLTVSEISIDSGNHGYFDFTMQIDAPFDLGSGEAFDIELTYSPQGEGAHTGRVIISSNDPNAPEGWVDLIGRATSSPMCDIHVQPATVDFGSVPVAGFSNQIITISNNGDSDCRISAIDGPTGSADFSLPTMPGLPMIVPPGEARQLTVKYQPGEAGSDQATLTLVCDGDPDEPETDITLTGEGVEPPPCDFQVDPALLNFGVIPIGDHRELNSRIWNFGSETCTIFSWNLTLNSDPVFIPSSLPFPQPRLGPGGFVDVNVAFDPQSPGLFNGTLEVKGGMSALDVLIVNIELSGAADPARMCINPEVLDFGPVGVGSQHDMGFDITACGGADLQIRQVSFDGVNPDFSFVTAPAVPFTLQSGLTRTIEVRYAPSDAGMDFGRVLISSNDNQLPTGVVHLTGNYSGTCPSVFYCQPDRLVFPATDIGRSSVMSFICINHGSETLTVVDVSREAGTSSEFSVSAPGIPLLVPPGGELHVEVEYLPADVGTDGGAVLISSEFGSAGCDNFTLITVPVEAEGITPDLPECIEPSQFQPQLQFAWPNGNISNPQWVQVGMTPIVINLTDDDGDGQIDEGDVPDIVFNSFLGVQGVFDGMLRAISGDDGHEIWTIPDLNLRTEYPTQLAAADIDGDNRPEILALKLAPRDANMLLQQTGNILCFEHDGSLKWESEPWHGPTGYYEDLSALGIADLDNDGHPEIFRGASVFDRHGHLLWEGTGGQGLIGAGSGVFSTAADLDGQGTMELVAGNTAYRADGTIMWQAAAPDGLAAVADFNMDGQPEVLLISTGLGGGVMILDGQTGAVLDSLDDPDVNAILPPVIADIDGSGGPEVALTGVVGAQFYFWGLDVSETDFQISVIWSDLLEDTTYGGGNTAFDFEGNGPFEVLHNGEKKVSIFTGLGHTQIYTAPRSSATYIEMPVVADVDNDGHAELIIVQNGGAGSLEFPPVEEGILVYGNLNDDWVATRRIWNQLDYHVTNVRENGTIPRFETPNWTVYNNFQTNEPFCE